MSYRIEYAAVPETAQIRNNHPLRTFFLTTTVFTVFLIALHTCFPRGWEVLQDLLWPGDAEVTRQAINTLVNDLRTGQTFSEAAQAFCREIMIHADIP